MLLASWPVSGWEFVSVSHSHHRRVTCHILQLPRNRLVSVGNLEEGSQQVPCGVYFSGKDTALLHLFKDVDCFLVGVASVHKEGP